MNDLDQLFHQPIRTKIMVYLSDVGETDYTTLKKSLNMSDGHMSTHMKKLVEAGFIKVTKKFVKNKPLTSYKLSKKGTDRFQDYLNHLKSIIAQLGD